MRESVKELAYFCLTESEGFLIKAKEPARRLQLFAIPARYRALFPPRQALYIPESGAVFLSDRSGDSYIYSIRARRAYNLERPLVLTDSLGHYGLLRDPTRSHHYRIDWRTRELLPLADTILNSTVCPFFEGSPESISAYTTTFEKRTKRFSYLTFRRQGKGFVASPKLPAGSILRDPRFTGLLQKSVRFVHDNPFTRPLFSPNKRAIVFLFHGRMEETTSVSTLAIHYDNTYRERTTGLLTLPPPHVFLNNCEELVFTPERNYLVRLNLLTGKATDTNLYDQQGNLYFARHPLLI